MVIKEEWKLYRFVGLCSFFPSRLVIWPTFPVSDRLDRSMFSQRKGYCYQLKPEASFSDVDIKFALCGTSLIITDCGISLCILAIPYFGEQSIIKQLRTKYGAILKELQLQVLWVDKKQRHFERVRTWSFVLHN